jgi:hypothetical protein
MISPPDIFSSQIDILGRVGDLRRKIIRGESADLGPNRSFEITSLKNSETLLC